MCASRNHTRKVPSVQNALDIFKGEWTSKLPGEYAELRAGDDTTLFNDPRITWAMEMLGGVKGLKILELGPLEGGHTYMLEKNGASEIVSIEANVRAYLRCLITKEILGLQRAKFLCGDFLEYLRQMPDWFDFCIASGVLYHLQNPAELISLIARVSNKALIWTHYYEPSLISKNPDLLNRFSGSQQQQYGGFSYTANIYQYKAERETPGFCGGGLDFSHWMSRQEILDCLQYFGWEDLEINLEDPNHPNGPAFTILATNSKTKVQANGN
jgi:SAM-dependent methyltransferase